MLMDTPHLTVRFADSDADLRAVERLRYGVFITELGGDGPLVDHAARRERDRFDPFCDHLLLQDARRPEADRVIGTYRLMSAEQAARAGQFYCESEYDLGPLRTSGRRLLELGRSCVHREYRGGLALMQLWNGLAGHVARNGIDVLFGVASFPGTDPAAIAAPLSLLHHHHRAPEALRPVARSEGGAEGGATPMDLVPAAALDRSRAGRAIPPLLKAYLRLGGTVGEGAYIDRAFNCIDVCVVTEIAKMPKRPRLLNADGPAA